MTKPIEKFIATVRANLFCLFHLFTAYQIVTESDWVAVVEQVSVGEFQIIKVFYGAGQK